MVDMGPAVWAGQFIRQLLPMKNTVDLAGAFGPTLFGFNTFLKGVKLSDLTVQVARHS
jgi:hypothetical protein